MGRPSRPTRPNLNSHAGFWDLCGSSSAVQVVQSRGLCTFGAEQIRSIDREKALLAGAQHATLDLVKNPDLPEALWLELNGRLWHATDFRGLTGILLIDASESRWEVGILIRFVAPWDLSASSILAGCVGSR
jgi:hypothetical protein